VVPKTITYLNAETTNSLQVYSTDSRKHVRERQMEKIKFRARCHIFQLKEKEKLSKLASFSAVNRVCSVLSFLSHLKGKKMRHQGNERGSYEKKINDFF